MYIKCWILFAEYLFEDEPYLVPREKLLNMRERKLHSVSDDGTTFEEYLNGKFVSKNVRLILYYFFYEDHKKWFATMFLPNRVNKTCKYW